MIDTMFVEIYNHEILKDLGYLDSLLRDKLYDLRSKSNVGPTENIWRCPTFNTLGQYDVLQDESFKSLKEIIIDKVKSFSKIYGALGNNVTLESSWLNLAKPGDYQEFHIHAKSHFSVVYYIDVPENSGSIFFNNHRSFFDMFPMETNHSELPGIGAFSHQPTSHELLIFRSYLPHMVDINCSDRDRISLSANFVVD